MKVLIFSAILFLIILAAVVLNTLYSNKTLSHMEELANRAYEDSTSGEVLSELINYWEHHKGFFSLTASLEKLDKIDENLLCFQAAITENDAVLKEKSYLLLKNSIEDIALFERLSFVNIF